MVWKHNKNDWHDLDDSWRGISMDGDDNNQKEVLQAKFEYEMFLLVACQRIYDLGTQLRKENVYIRRRIRVCKERWVE